MFVQPYLSFEGRAEEAIEFYKKAVGAKVTMMMRNKESPEQPPGMPPNSGDKIMHCAMTIGDSVVMATDGMMSGNPKFGGISLTINADSDADAKKYFNNLAEGGQVSMPLNKTFFASSFGMVADKFGVHWMVIAGPTNP